MEDAVGAELRRIVLRYGPAIGEDARRVEALLRDLAGEHRREIAVLVGAAREGVPAELMSSRGAVPAAVLEERLARTLQDNLGLSEDAARWAVTTWAAALAGTVAAAAPSAAALAGPSAPVLSEAEVADRLMALPLDESGDLAWSVLGLIVAADGPLDMADAAGIVHQPVRQVHRAIAPVADLIVRDGQLEAGGETFRRAVTRYLGQTERDAQRQALVRWCAERVTSRQPGQDIPEYILRYGGDHLIAAGDTDVLSWIVDRDWMGQSAARTGSLTAFVRDMARIAEAAASKSPPDRRLELKASLAGVTTASVAASIPPQALGALAAAGQSERALDLASSVESGSRSDAYYRIASALQAAGAAEPADAVAEAAIAVALSEARETGSYHSLLSLVYSMHEHGAPGWALRALSALQAGGVTDEYTDVLAAKVLAAAGDADGAWRAARGITGKSFQRDEAFETAAIALVRAGRIQEAIEAAREVSSNAGALDGKLAAITAERGDVRATMTVVESSPDDNFRRWVVIQAGKVWGRACRVDDISAIMKIISSPEDRQYATREVATVLAGSGQVSLATDMWTAVATEEDRERFIADLVKAAADAGDIGGALRAASVISDGYQRGKALTHVASAVARTGDRPRTTDILDEIEDEYRRSNALAEVAKDLTAHGRLDEAVAVIGTIPRPGVKAESQVAVANALVAAGDYPRGAAVADEAARATSRGSGVHVRALLAQATAVALAGRPEDAVAVAERAEAVAREASDQKLLTDALATRSTVLAAWPGHEDEAVAAARNVVRLIRQEDVIAGSDAAYQQDRQAESIAAILAQAGPPRVAIEAAESIADEHHRDKALTEAAAVFARRGLADQAIEATRASSSASRSPFEAERSLNEVARALARRGDGEGALKAVAALPGDGALSQHRQDSMVGEVLRILAENGHVEAALAAAVASTPRWNRPSRLAQLAGAVAEADDPRLFALLAETAADLGPNGLAKVADALAAANRIDEALPLADDAIRRALTEAPTSPYAATALASLERLAEAFGTGDKTDAGQEPADEMTDSERDAAARQAVRRARAITDPVQRARALLFTVWMLAVSSDPGLKAEAVAMAGELRQDARRLQDRFDRASLLDTAARMLVACGETALAAETAQECLDSGGSLGAQFAIGLLLDIGQPVGALAGIGSLDGDASKVAVFHQVALRLAGTGQAGDLPRLVDETGVLDLIADAQQRISALAGLGVVLAQAGEATSASGLAERVAALAAEVTGDREQALMRAGLAELLAALGRRPEAVEQARQALAAPREALGGWWGAMATKAVKVLVECGQVAEAVAVVKTAPATGRAESAVTVAAELFNSGGRDRAIELVSDEFAAVRAAGSRDTFYNLMCEHLARYPDLFRAWLGEAEIAQIGVDLAAIEQWWA